MLDEPFASLAAFTRRTLEDTFRPEFVDIVHELRLHIGRELRTQTGGTGAA